MAPDSLQRLRAENEELRLRLEEAEQTIEAIRSGQADSLVVDGAEGVRVYSLESAIHSYRVLVESMSEGAATLSRSGTVLYCNSQLAELLGRPLEQVMGSTLREHVAPPQVAEFDAICRAGWEDTSRGETVLRTGAGEAVRVHLSTSRLVEGDQPILCIVATDLTEQVRAEEILASERLARSVLEQSAEAIVVCDRDERIIRASRSAVELCGDNPLLQPFSRMFPIDVLPEHGGGRPASSIAERALCGEVLRGTQTRLFREDGRIVALQAAAAPLTNADGEIVGCVITLTDTTERERLAYEVEQALELRDRFISVASHELKTPLSSLSLVVQSMERARQKLEDPERLERNLASASRQIARLTQLVNDLLDVSRIRAGRLQLSIEPVDLCAVVREVADRYAHEASRAGCSLEVTAPGAIVGAWDRSRVDQVVSNLLSNAVKYGAGKPVSVSVEASGGAARIHVADRGIGIAPDDHARIFEPFERAASVREFGGMGLGLWIAHEIVTRLGGAVRVDSRLGEGARFVVELPLGDPVERRPPT